MENQIRIATANDVEQLVELLNELFSQDIEFEPDYDVQKRGLLAIIENPDLGCILVSCFDQKIIGMVSILYSISTALGGKVGVLEDMIITKEYQSNENGKTLL